MKSVPHRLGKAAIIILPQLNVGHRKELARVAEEFFGAYFISSSAGTEIFIHNRIDEKDRSITGIFLMVTLNSLQRPHIIEEFHERLAREIGEGPVPEIYCFFEGELRMLKLTKLNDG